MYPHHYQNRLDYSDDLMISLILALFWLSGMGQICGFWAFPQERMEGIAWNFVWWCILTTSRTGLILVKVCLFSSFWHHLNLVKHVKFGIFGHFPENAWREWPRILHADLFWPPSELIRFWSCSVDFPHYGAPLGLWISVTDHIWGLRAFSGEHLGVNVEGGAEAYFRCFVSRSV